LLYPPQKALIPSDSITETDMIRYWIDAPPAPQNDWVAREEPLEIRIQGRSIAVTMRTPGNDDELACGFLVSEGLLHQREDVMEVSHCLSGENAILGNILNVFASPHVRINFDQLTRHVFASSSCGLCGKASIESVHQSFPPIDSTPPLDPDFIRLLPDKLLSSQAAFAKSGGLHAAALFDQSGNLLVLREDVGRHNAVDKVVGWAFLEELLPLSEHILLVSGRASFEIMQKALAARIPVVAAISAPSSLAIDFARQSRQTLIGFLRPPSFNVYSASTNL
jgi:FdhD protein